MWRGIRAYIGLVCRLVGRGMAFWRDVMGQVVWRIENEELMDDKVYW